MRQYRVYLPGFSSAVKVRRADQRSRAGNRRDVHREPSALVESRAPPTVDGRIKPGYESARTHQVRLL